ncbi:hypothetical protein ACEQ8H_006558 [Pleosporales sp. CAS-2024a]
MAKNNFEPAPHYAPPPNSPFATMSQARMTPAPYTAPNVLPAKLPTQTPADPLEQRILDLLYPYRDECFAPPDKTTDLQERKALILCENIAFIIRHHQTTYGKCVEPNDINMASRNWIVMKEGNHGRMAGVSIFVNGATGYTHTVIRANVKYGESMVDCLTLQADAFLEEFFPGI